MFNKNHQQFLHPLLTKHRVELKNFNRNKSTLEGVTFLFRSNEKFLDKNLSVSHSKKNVTVMSKELLEVSHPDVSKL